MSSESIKIGNYLILRLLFLSKFGWNTPLYDTTMVGPFVYVNFCNHREGGIVYPSGYCTKNIILKQAKINPS